MRDAKKLDLRGPEYGKPYQESTYGPGHKQQYLRLRSETLASLLEESGGHGPKRVLEVACGPGLSLAHLGRETGHTLVGIDMSPKMLQTAAENVRRTGRSVGLARASAFQLPFADGTFDFVYATRFIHLFRDKTPVVRELMRVARPGAHVAVEFYTRPFHLLAYLKHRPRVPLSEHLYHYPSLSEVRRVVGPDARFIPLRLGGERILRRVLGDAVVRRVLGSIWNTPAWPAVAEYFAVIPAESNGTPASV